MKYGWKPNLKVLDLNIELSGDYKYFWTYIPHFIHTPFYVYAYAFGDCLVNILIQLFDENHPNFKKLYLDLEKSIKSNYKMITC